MTRTPNLNGLASDDRTPVDEEVASRSMRNRGDSWKGEGRVCSSPVQESARSVKTITRRDFLNGAAVTLAAGAILRPHDLLAGEGSAVAATPIGKDYYPPTLTGMRGSHDGSFEVAHALAWRGEKPTEYAALDEAYDLVIVGGGLSGLASAYLYRKQAGADKKILILENHDDFGGHAKRNEFHCGRSHAAGGRRQRQSGARQLQRQRTHSCWRRSAST